MPLKFVRGLLFISALAAVGLLKAAQRNALFLEGYALGEQTQQAHQTETDVAWLQTRVLNLTSPAHLADMVQARHLKLVAWSVLSPEQVNVLADSMDAASAASPEPVQLADGRDTSD